MLPERIFWWNAVASLIVCSLLLSVLNFPPDSAEKEAHVYCSSSGEPDAVLPDMEACVAAMSRVPEWNGCGCFRPPKYPDYFYRLYFFVTIPVLFALVGVLFLRGPLALQLGVIEGSLVVSAIAFVLFRNTLGYTDGEEHLGTLFFTGFIGAIAGCVLAVTRRKDGTLRLRRRNEPRT